MALKNWSTNPSSNVSGLTGINWNEGMNAASVNDSARATMAQLAVWRDQIKGGTIYPASIGGTANAITLTCSPTIDAYATGQRFLFKASSTNTGSTTVNVDGLGTKTVKFAGANLNGGEITSGDLVHVAYDGTNLQLLSPQRAANQNAVLLSNFASLSAADTAAQAVGGYIFLNTDITLGAHTTITSRIVGDGGVISVNGHILTLSSLYEAPDRSQLFDVSVTSSLVTCVDGQYAQPEHFGWLGGGGDGGNAALSLNSFQGAKDFGVGVYTTSKSLILDDKHHIRGMGWRSQIKVANGANVPAIATKNFSNFVANQDYGVFPEDFSIENICVNGNALTSVNDEGDAGNTTNDGIQITAARYLLKNVYVFGAAGHGINSPVNNDSTNKPTSPYDRTVQNEAIWQNIHATRNGGNGINYGGPNDAWLDVIFTYTNLGKGLYVYNNSFANIGFIHSYSNHGRNCHIDTGASLRVTQGHYRDGLIENLVIDGSYFGSYVLCNDAWISGSPQYSVIINGQTHIGIAEIQTNNGESGINITSGSTTIEIGKLECYVASGTAGAVGVNYASTAKVKIKGTIAGFADNLVSNNGQGNMWELSLTTTSTSYGLKLSRDNSAQDGNFWKISYTGAYLIDPGGGVTTFNERDYVEVLHVNGSGARSHNSILADQVCAVDSAGIKGPFTVAHGLVQAPNVGNIGANFYKGGGTYARDWMGNILIESADATNITYYVNVGTSSATSGAKGSVKFTAKIGGMYV